MITAVRWAAVAALDAINPEADLVIPGLTLALQNWNVGVRSSAIYALIRIRPAIPGLMTALQSQDSQVRYGALDALVLIGHYKGSPLPGHITALQHQDVGIRHRAAVTLGELLCQCQGSCP